MRHLIALAAVLFLSSPAPAAAQLVAPNGTGVAMGHVHVFARDVEAMRQFLRLLGGEPTQNGTLQMISYIKDPWGTRIEITEGLEAKP